MSRTAERIACADEAPGAGLIERVRSALALGGLVAVPTESVYGLAARADLPEALESLRRAKGLEAGRALTWHVGSAERLERFPRLSPMARRLAERYWPGPLTLVLPGAPEGLEAVAAGGWTGVRLPAHRGTAGLLRKMPFPVVASSANRTGHEPAADADAVADVFGDELELVLDGGPARLGESSAVVAVGPGRFELLREGLLDLDALRATAGLRIGFVCTGNTCRSPMAEALARQVLVKELEVPAGELSRFGFELRSMGMAGGYGSPASPHATEALAEVDVDLSGHGSRAATLELVEGLDRVYAMTRTHVEALRRLLPPGKDDHVELLDPEGGEVSDPIGGSLDDYRRTRDQIGDLVRARLAEWA